MKKMKFKTNINCGGCIASVTPNLDKVAGKGNWQVDISNPEKILTVEVEDISEEEVKEAVRRAGYRIEEIS